jgi:hypothetical protein
MRYTHTRVFCEKSAQVIENKDRERETNDQEAASV